jgi:hypothetical protein
MSESFEKWDIWLADVPFEEIEETKKRPVLILDEQHCVVVCLKMTSQLPKIKTDYQIRFLDGTGLEKNTVIRLAVQIRLPKESMIKKLGTLHTNDKSILKVMCSVG